MTPMAHAIPPLSGAQRAALADACEHYSAPLRRPRPGRVVRFLVGELFALGDALVCAGEAIGRIASSLDPMPLSPKGERQPTEQ